MPPKTFSLSAKVSFPDHKKVAEELKHLAEQALAKDPNILEIYLFGSRAGDRPSARSDADLLIVLKQGAPRPVDRIPQYLRWFLKAPVPVDVFPVTKSELESNRVAQEALRHGRRLCRR